MTVHKQCQRGERLHYTTEGVAYLNPPPPFSYDETLYSFTPLSPIFLPRRACTGVDNPLWQFLLILRVGLGHNPYRGAHKGGGGLRGGKITRSKGGQDSSVFVKWPLCNVPRESLAG